MKRKPTRTKSDVAALNAMVEDATVDSNDESDQVMGLFNTLVEHLELPFETSVLGIKVKVERLEMTVRDQIVAICASGRIRQAIGILDVPLPALRPAGAEWIDAYRHWASAR